MLEDIKKKIKDDTNCELSIDELIELNKLSYEELVEIFGKKHIARTPEEITIDTICYVGYLKIKEELPTYNLKYIFGKLIYEEENIINLENLCFIGGDFTFYNVKDLSDLSELFENKEYMLYAVKRDGCALEYAPEEFKNDREIVLEAVKQNENVIYILPGRIKEFLLSLALENNEKISPDLSESENDITGPDEDEDQDSKHK